MAAEKLDEFDRIARYFRPLAAGFPGALGLTDDAAAFTVPDGQELVVTTDAIVAGIHFLPDDTPADIARKALRVNLSDLAAKGAEPFAYLLTLALPNHVGDAWVAAFAAALHEDQKRYGIALAGGDSVSTTGPVWVSITAFGTAAAGHTVRRSGAQPGDHVFVTGTIGDAALGLAALQNKLSVSGKNRDALIARYRVPEPRVLFAYAIAKHAHAALDVSDGLAADLGHLCEASHVDGIVEARFVPLSETARKIVDTDATQWKRILTGGDDYEILFAAPAAAADALVEAAKAANIPLTRIGETRAGSGKAILLDAHGQPIKLDKPGWTHA